VARFSIPITATPDDIDELGHVGNLVYLRWVLDVAMAHTRALGYDIPQYQALGAVFVVRRHEIDYIAQVRDGDVLRGDTWISSWRGASCIRNTELVRGEQVVVRASTHWAFMSLSSGRPTRIPEPILALFSSASG
jgi:acyl-CoA thioester hydrolase